MEITRSASDKTTTTTHLLNSKLLVGLDLDLTSLLTSLLRDERDLAVSVPRAIPHRSAVSTHHLVHLGLDLRVIELAGLGHVGRICIRLESGEMRLLVVEMSVTDGGTVSVTVRDIYLCLRFNGVWSPRVLCGHLLLRQMRATSVRHLAIFLMLRALQRTVRPAVLGTARYATAAHPCLCTLRLATASRTPVDLCFRPPLRRYAHAALKDAEPSAEEEELELQQEEAEELASPSSVILRPYQTEAIDACLAALQAGKRRIGVSSPTGSGKTTMFMHLIPHIPWNSATSDPEGDRDLGVDREFHEEAATAQHRNKGQVLILVGSVELASQAEAAARRILGTDYTVEVEQSRRVATGYADM